MDKQTARGKAQDKRKTAKRTLEPTKKNAEIWRKNKNRIDIEGVDTKQKPKTKIKMPKKTKAKSVHAVGGGSTANISKKTQSIQQRGKISKTAAALNRIRADYAKHGKDTGVAMRAYTENRISYAKYQEYAKQGMRIFNKK